jgi:hypothetical protein
MHVSLYTDRRLGVSESVLTAAGAIQLFTGNNIGPKGDLASRSLTVRLDADRADPENCVFKHSDPVAWTDAHRVEILRALYMVLLGNPTLKKPRNAAMRTRFKMWWRLVGSAVEHAAELAARYDGEAKAARAALESDKQVVDFCALFIDQDADDEEDSSLVEALTEFRAWAARTRVERKATGRTFSAADLAPWISDTNRYPNPVRDAYRECFFPTLEPGQRVSAFAVGRRLKSRVDEPVRGDGVTLILRSRKSSPQGHAPAVYWVEVKADLPGDAPISGGDGGATAGEVEP